MVDNEKEQRSLKQKVQPIKIMIGVKSENGRLGQNGVRDNNNRLLCLRNFVDQSAPSPDDNHQGNHPKPARIFVVREIDCVGVDARRTQLS